jgi:hypothetical protein
MRHVAEEHGFEQDGDNGLTPLEKAQFLRHRYENGKSIHNYLKKWTVSDDLR